MPKTSNSINPDYPPPPPTVSAGPTPSASAASTLPISSTGSDVEPADIGTEYQSNVDERNPIANSPDAILISDTSDVEYEDDGSKEVLIQVKKFGSRAQSSPYHIPEYVA